jgi:plasmid stabilization system protein ParE
MSLAITFHNAASTEFLEASSWYESKRSGLAIEFTAEIDRCVKPLQFIVVHKDIRRVIANRFPYGIYYRVEERRIVVLAVFHSSRNPSLRLARS